MAENEEDPPSSGLADDRRSWAAGPTGVEIAGQIARARPRSLRGDFRTHRPGDGAGAAARRRGQRPSRPSATGSRQQAAQRARAARGRDPHRHASSRGSTRRASTSRRTTVDRADRRARPDLGRGRGGVAARPAARRGDGRRASTGPVAWRSCPTCTLPGPPRGVRRRRHDGARRAARSRRGRDAVGHPCRATPSSAACDGKEADRSRYRDLGSMADHLALPRGGELQGAAPVAASSAG